MEPALSPQLPDYGGACISGLAPGLSRPVGSRPAWLPSAAAGADRIVLFVLDGLGWLQLQDRAELCPALAALDGGPATSVAPTTTAAALTSITTGAVPADHGLLGYRMAVGGEVLNILRWTTSSGDARDSLPPEEVQPLAAFGGRRVPVVTRAEFAGSGFSRAHLAGTAMVGWRSAADIPDLINDLLGRGHPLVYAYYDGIDHSAHEEGLGPRYEKELRTADELVERIVAVLPSDTALVVTADHGQVDVGSANVELPRSAERLVEFRSGEGRFRWLHARPGRREELLRAATDAHGHQAWVVSREEVDAARWFGERLPEALGRRVGDVALVARDPVGFVDPTFPAEARMVCRHGSLTPEELLVPLLACTR
ncbi:MAG TPA: alkaline phosphatase family protein [Acidimicrobiales bacterium]|nr:alkaline phosphatase family protein [Acidimicrobiales bacterium]